MNRDEATETLREVERLERVTAARLRSFWQPFIVWGVLALGSVPLAAGDRYRDVRETITDPATGIVLGHTVERSDSFDTALLWYWAFALPIGLAACILLYRRRHLRPQFPYAWVAVVAGFLLLTPLGLFAVTKGGLVTRDAIVTMFTAVALVNLGFGIATRTRALAWTSGLLFLLSGFSVFVASHRPIVLSSSFAGVYLIGGWLTKQREAR